MTLQDAMDEVAKADGHKDGWNIEYTFKLNYTSHVIQMKRAAELYGKSKWEEAADAQRKMCLDRYMAIDVYNHSNKFETIDREMDAIKNAPKPEFKP